MLRALTVQKSSASRTMQMTKFQTKLFLLTMPQIMYHTHAITYRESGERKSVRG